MVLFGTFFFGHYRLVWIPSNMAIWVKLNITIPFPRGRGVSLKRGLTVWAYFKYQTSIKAAGCSMDFNAYWSQN